MVFNWESISTERKIIKGIRRLVDVFDFELERSPMFKVKIFEYPGSRFLASSNCKIWGPDQGSPYSHCSLYGTIEETVSALLTGYENYYSPECPDELLFWVFPNESHDIATFLYIDGSGESVPYEEVLRRRALRK
ncbi:MAG: hypothetical protein K8S15_04420 [Candidatus Aegiribacteria sp.]|nr:hypothetical protein [Candidatus Aegiribacteria sp.]